MEKLVRHFNVTGGRVVARVYPLMCDAVEVGVTVGLNRAHKHTEEPAREVVVQAVYDAVMSEITDRFNFPDDDTAWAGYPEDDEMAEGVDAEEIGYAG